MNRIYLKNIFCVLLIGCITKIYSQEPENIQKYSKNSLFGSIGPGGLYVERTRAISNFVVGFGYQKYIGRHILFVPSFTYGNYNEYAFIRQSSPPEAYFSSASLKANIKYNLINTTNASFYVSSGVVGNYATGIEDNNFFRTQNYGINFSAGFHLYAPKRKVNYEIEIYSLSASLMEATYLDIQGIRFRLHFQLPLKLETPKFPNPTKASPVIEPVIEEKKEVYGVLDTVAIQRQKGNEMLSKSRLIPRAYFGLYFSGDASYSFFGPSVQGGVDLPVSNRSTFNAYGHYFIQDNDLGSYQVTTLAGLYQYNFGKKRKTYIGIGISLQRTSYVSSYLSGDFERTLVLPVYRFGYNIASKRFIYCPEIVATGPYSTSRCYMSRGMTFCSGSTELLTFPSIGLRIFKKPYSKLNRKFKK